MGTTASSEASIGQLQYLDSHLVDVEGVSCSEMTIRVATGRVLGKLQGFLVDPVAQQLKYLVVSTSSWFGELGGTKVLPFVSARVDAATRAIEVLANDFEVQSNRDSLSSFSADQLLHT